MYTLTQKLTLAFLVVALLGALLVALIMGRQTRVEFDRFLLDQYRERTVASLLEFYAAHGSWQDVERQWRREQGGFRPDPDVVADAEGRIVLSPRRELLGRQLSADQIARAHPITLDGSPIGWIIFDRPPIGPGLPESAAALFLQRFRQALMLAALAAIAIALVVGVLLARSITRPLQELTAATQALAQGKLGQQVEVRSRDELGVLAASFNQMSADLARSTQVRRQMTADIAHDLRTPLSVILGYAEALSDGKLTGSPEMYQVLYQEANHLKHLIDDLRTLSLADAGELPLNRQSVDVPGLLHRVALAHQPRARELDIELSVEAPVSLPSAEIDPERMAQVLGNLINNALRYTSEGGRIRLGASAQGGTLLLQVEDNGSGIDPSDLPFVFERSYRGDKSRRENGESGLGLPIAKSIVEAHGGTVQVESTLNQGTIVTVRLPLAAA